MTPALRGVVAALLMLAVLGLWTEPKFEPVPVFGLVVLAAAFLAAYLDIAIGYAIAVAVVLVVAVLVVGPQLAFLFTIAAAVALGAVTRLVLAPSRPALR